MTSTFGDEDGTESQPARSPAATSPGAPLSQEERLVVYQTVAARRVATDGMVWQVPGLGLTAQAFLVTIELAKGTGRAARILAGLLSIMISLMSVQLLMKHRLHERADSIWLENFERSCGWDLIHAVPRDRLAQLGLRPHLLTRYRSYQIWIIGLCSFGVVGLATAFNALLRG